MKKLKLAITELLEDIQTAFRELLAEGKGE